MDAITQIADSRETTEDDLCTHTGWLEDRGISATARFELDGETYYMGVGLHGETYPRSGSATSSSLEAEKIREKYFDIGFYVSLTGKEEFARIVDVDLLADIEQAFDDTLRLEVKGLNYEDEDRSFTAPDVMPAMHRARGDEQCFECTILELGKENWGNYAISGYGTVNGEEISVHTTYGWKPVEGIIFEPTGDDPVGEINQYLASLDAETKGNLKTYMPEGTFAGYITVPDALSRVEITMFGAPTQGRPTTVIRGGVQAEGNAKKNVLYYPQAATADFEEFLYDTSFYRRQPVVSVDFTKIFPIPVGALDGAEFTVMKGETELARITCEAAEEGQSLSLLGGSNETFDATVQVERTEDCIQITLQAIPAGKAPVISVPCGAGWTAVAVTGPEGDPLEGTVAGGYASFVARTGGTYVIERVVPCHIDSVTLCTENGDPLDQLQEGVNYVKVSLTNVKFTGDALVMAATCTADGQYLGLASQPVENLALNDSREVALPVDNSGGKVKDLTVFVVTSLADPVPLGDSKPLLP